MLYQLSYTHSDNFLRDQKGNPAHSSSRGVLWDDSVAPKDGGSTIVMSNKGKLLGGDTPMDRCVAANSMTPRLAEARTRVTSRQDRSSGLRL